MNWTLTKHEKEIFNLGRHFRWLCQKPDDRMPSVERDICQSLEREHRACGLTTSGSTVPFGVLTRGLTTTAGNLGGFMVQTDVAAGFVDALRPRSVCLSLGADAQNGLVGDQSLPTETATASMQWLAPGVTATKTALTLGALNMVPHRLVGQLAYSTELLFNSDNRISQVVSNDLRKLAATALDQAALTGTGAVQPLGILNTSGCQTTTFGGSANQSNLSAFETKCTTANIPETNPGWVISPATRSKLRNAPENGTGSQLIYRDGKILGQTAETTNNVSTTNQVIFSSAWENLLFGIWGDGLDLIVDPFTNASTGQILVTACLFADVGLKQPLAFVFSTDEGNQ